MTPLPQEEDPNVLIDAEIESRLFDERFLNMETDEMNQYNFEMRPYLYPDVD